MKNITSDLCKARDLLNGIKHGIHTDSEARGFETAAETNCLYHIDSAIDGLCEVIEFYAGDYERQSASTA